jgi:hypothetical protein
MPRFVRESWIPIEEATPMNDPRRMPDEEPQLVDQSGDAAAPQAMAPGDEYYDDEGGDGEGPEGADPQPGEASPP